jgi:tetratricopeptide (TPR) repeat protein
MPLFGKKKPEDMKEIDLFTNGSKAFSEQKWEEASEYFRILLNKTPTFTQGREMLTMSLIQEHKADDALEHCRYLIDQNPQKALYYVQLASIYQIQEKTEDAIRELSHALELQEDPKYRGMLLYLKTPDIPLINVESVGDSAGSLLARVFSNMDKSEIMQIPELNEATSEVAEIGKRMQGEILEAKKPEVFMKEIADACIKNNCYAKVEDLLKKFKNLDEIKTQLQILESQSGIIGRFAQFYHLNFVHFEKIASE